MLSQTAVADRARRVLIIGRLDPSGALVRHLERERFEVVQAQDPIEAGRLAATAGFATVILGDDPSGGKPADLPPALRGGPDDEGPLVFAVGRAESAASMLTSGADGFLREPVEPVEVSAGARVGGNLWRLRDELRRRTSTLTEANRELEQVNRRMRDELAAASAVQNSLLPRRLPRLPGVRVGWALRPCTELAGDILNCFRLDEHHVAFYLLDVSGHGVSAALLSVQIARTLSPLMSESSLLKEPLQEPPWYRVVEPDRVAERLNRTFQTHDETRQYFTIVYGTLHLASGRLRLVSAGQPGPIAVGAEGGTTTIGAGGMPIGLFAEACFETFETTLEPGCRLWLYSDGVTEIVDGDGRMLGESTLRELISLRSREPVQTAVDRTLEAVERWGEPRQPADDCSLLAIERACPAS